MNAVDTVKQALLASGAGWILWFLGALSAASLAFAAERWWYLRGRAGNLEELARRLDAALGAGDFARAGTVLNESRAVAARVAGAGLRLRERGAAAAEKAMQSATALERTRLERGLAFLATVGNNAPFVGLFGTVVGVIHAFEELGHDAAGRGAATSAGHAPSQAVMASIAEALVATAVGIAVALPAVATYNYLQRRVASLLAGSDVLTNLVLAYMTTTASDARDGGSSPGRVPEEAVDGAA